MGRPHGVLDETPLAPAFATDRTDADSHPLHPWSNRGFVQIEHLVPEPGHREVLGTRGPRAGVGLHDHRGGRLSRTKRGFLTLALLSLGLLGQGERANVDPRFMSPSATLRTYWCALRDGNANEAWECLVEGRHDLPRPGMLWFLPPASDLTLGEFRSLPVTRGRILVSYEVRYRPPGSTDTLRFRSADELVRMRGEWRIARPIGEATMPQWRPTPQPVDI